MPGISRQAADERRASAKLRGVRIRSDWQYPAAQFDDGEVLDGIPEIISGMTDTGPWAALDFLLAEHGALAGYRLSPRSAPGARLRSWSWSRLARPTPTREPGSDRAGAAPPGRPLRPPSPGDYLDARRIRRSDPPAPA
jgi:hypothetical protein